MNAPRWALLVALVACNEPADTGARCEAACSVAASTCLEVLCGDVGCAAALDCDADCFEVHDACVAHCAGEPDA